MARASRLGLSYGGIARRFDSTRAVRGEDAGGAARVAPSPWMLEMGVLVPEDKGIARHDDSWLAQVPDHLSR